MSRNPMHRRPWLLKAAELPEATKLPEACMPFSTEPSTPRPERGIQCRMFSAMSANNSPAARLEARIPSLLSLAGLDRGARSFAPTFIAQHGDSLRNLQRGLTGDRLLAGSGYMEDPAARAAYFLYYWPVSYMQVAMALEEIRARKPGFRIFRALDVGSGPGPASAALADFAPGIRCTLVDSSAAALDLGAAILGKVSGESLHCDLETDPELPEGPFDTIVACHSFNELWKDKPDGVASRANLAKRLWERLAPGGVLLILEPAALPTARPALELRDRLLATLPGAKMLAPCTTDRPCPAFASGPERSCHSEWPWKTPELVAALASRAGLDRNSAKSTWFALEKPDFPGKADSVGEGESGLSRIVSDPMLNKAGRVRYLLCSDSGLSTVSAKRDDPAATAQGFFALRRGDLLAPKKLERREGTSSWGFGPSSSLDIVAKVTEHGLDGH